MLFYLTKPHGSILEIAPKITIPLDNRIILYYKNTCEETPAQRQVPLSSFARQEGGPVPFQEKAVAPMFEMIRQETRRTQPGPVGRSGAVLLPELVVCI